MQPQTKSKAKSHKSSNNQYLRLLAWLSLAAIAISNVALAQNDSSVTPEDMNSQQAQASQQRTAEDLLQTAEVQISQKWYALALQQLQEARQYRNVMTADQTQRLDSYTQQAQAGLDAANQAQAALDLAEQLIDQQQYGQANRQLQVARDNRAHLEGEAIDRIEQLGEQVEAGLETQRAEMVELFANSKDLLNQGQLDQAEAGFNQVRDSGIELSYFERGWDWSTPQDYLDQIAERRAEMGQTAAPQTDLMNAAQPANATPVRETTPQPAAQPADEQPSTQFSLWPFGSSEPERQPLSPEEQAQVDRLIAQGNQATQQGNYQLARQHYSQALQLDPANESAQRGLDAADFLAENSQAAQPESTQPTIRERLAERHNAERQYIESSLVSTRQRIDELMQQALFDQARAEAGQVLTRIEGSQQLLGPEAYTRLRDQAQAMLQDINNRQETYEEETLRRQIAESEQRELQRQMETERSRQQTVEQLYNQAIAFRDAREYDQSVATLMRLLELSPNHERAGLLLEHMLDMQTFVGQDDIQSLTNNEETAVLTDARRAAIPWSDHVTYGDNWIEMTQRRRMAESHRVYQGTPRRRAILEALDNTLIDLDYTDTEFSQVIDDLRLTDMNIFVAWNDMELAGIFPEDLVTIQLNQISIASALERILDYVSGGRLDRAGYIVDDDGIININTISVLGETYAHYQRVYYVADLLGQRAEAGSSYLDLGSGSSSGGSSSSSRSSGSSGSSRSSSSSSSSGSSRPSSSSSGSSSSSSRGGSSSGSSRSSSSGRSSSSSSSSSGGDVYQRTDNLINMIELTVMPDSWEGYTNELGVEGRGTVDTYNNQMLVVYQTRSAHQQIEELLKELRRSLGEQVSIEARFLIINSNFLEDIGMDVDFFLNLGNAGFDPTGAEDASGRQILNPRANPGPMNRTTPFPIEQNSYGFTTPGATSVPGSLGGGATPTAFLISGSFLDNIQVDFLMRATQAHHRSRSLVAPHVTVFSGEEATVSFFTTQPYVGSLTAHTDNSVGIYEPVIEWADTGIELLVAPTVSADRRYVMLNVEVRQEEVLGFDEFTFNVGGETTGTDGDAGSAASTGTIQEPTLVINTLQTHVSVPDGGTLLLGGQKLVGEVEREMGVPGLSKIPVVNRLFSNRSIVQDESVLLILIKPRIILQQEEEDLRFGGLTTELQ
ncbi:MAG: tetratricopeptide repeat protein [Sedimentisphaerales bacterium]|nr:tetratricopeptide repeat protein [Sedimentisphaerales bacterium]